MRNNLGGALAGISALLVLASAAACTRGDAELAAGPAATGSAAAGSADSDTRAAEVYVQVLRRYLSGSENSFPGRTFRQVFVLERAVPSAGEAEPGGGAGTPIPDGTRQRITGALADIGTVSFVANRDAVLVMNGGCGVVKDEGILITLAPVGGKGNRIEVGINGYVACMGATWLTYVVEYTAGAGWKVTGTTGPIAVA